MYHIPIVKVTYFLSTYIAELCSSEYACLTWEIREEELVLTCKNIRFSHPVSLIDSQGKLYAKCRFIGLTHECTPIERKDLIVIDYARHNIIFTVAKLGENMNGVWVCLQDNLRLTTHVSFYKGKHSMNYDTNFIFFHFQVPNKRILNITMYMFNTKDMFIQVKRKTSLFACYHLILKDNLSFKVMEQTTNTCTCNRKYIFTAPNNADF